MQQPPQQAKILPLVGSKVVWRALPRRGGSVSVPLLRGGFCSRDTQMLVAQPEGLSQAHFLSSKGAKWLNWKEFGGSRRGMRKQMQAHVAVR